MFQLKNDSHYHTNNIYEIANTMKVLSLLSFLLLTSLPAIGQQLIWEANVNPDNFRTNGVQFTTNGGQILAGTDCHPAKIRRFDVENGDITWDYTLGDGLMCIMGVGIDASEQYVAAIEEFGNLLIFDYTLETPELITSIELGSDYAFATAFSPDSKHIAVAGTEGKVFIANAENGKIVHDINAHGDWVLSVCYSADGESLATGANDSRIKIWDTAGTLLHTLIGHGGDVTSVSFSKDGKFLFSASEDGSIKKWDCDKEEVLWSLKVSAKSVYDFALSPDGNFMAAVAKDKNLSIWNIASQNKLSSYPLPGDGGKTVDWSPTKKQVCVGTEQGDLMLLDISAPLTAYPLLSENEFVKLSPSPAQATSVVNYRLNTTSDIEMLVYSVDGKLLDSYPNLPGEGTTPLSIHLEAGLYLLEFRSSTGSLYREAFVSL